ncbi:DDE-type integrase/transposase/recombinase [Paenibacillus sp. EKM211P]|uniref:DDE-type integrase/transposase/recombinase n=1 Tax=Paenibacillus sp. EKM211P TaxID=1683679 RepID=UPI0013E99D12|nr:DDE-type integrase/transposase/recombinase [Paenibacillus sp. EKM211P]KAF6582690.1 DDE-type integrase/transposase/recombinase [Paenibacillus sp. EKM211P]
MREAALFRQTGICGKCQPIRSTISGRFSVIQAGYRYYIHTLRAGERFVYLSVIQDLFNNEIVACSERNDLALVSETLDVLSKNVNMEGVILHSDQGFQYTPKPFNRKFKRLGVLGSHSRRGNCLDNACIESFFSHLKTEKIYLTKPETLAKVEQHVREYISFYNENIFQKKKLNNRSSIEYRETVAA